MNFYFGPEGTMEKAGEQMWSNTFKDAEGGQNNRNPFMQTTLVTSLFSDFVFFKLHKSPFTIICR